MGFTRSSAAHWCKWQALDQRVRVCLSVCLSMCLLAVAIHTLLIHITRPLSRATNKNQINSLSLLLESCGTPLSQQPFPNSPPFTCPSRQQTTRPIQSMEWGMHRQRGVWAEIEIGREREREEGGIESLCAHRRATLTQVRSRRH